LPFTVTDVPSRLTGNLPFTISVAAFHVRESPAGARPVPKIVTHDPAEIAPARKLAPFTTPFMEILGAAAGAAGPLTVIVTGIKGTLSARSRGGFESYGKIINSIRVGAGKLRVRKRCLPVAIRR
jgi:hypothetical protein